MVVFPPARGEAAQTPIIRPPTDSAASGWRGGPGRGGLGAGGESLSETVVGALELMDRLGVPPRSLPQSSPNR